MEILNNLVKTILIILLGVILESLLITSIIYIPVKIWIFPIISTYGVDLSFVSLFIIISVIKIFRLNVVYDVLKSSQYVIEEPGREK